MLNNLLMLIMYACLLVLLARDFLVDLVQTHLTFLNIRLSLLLFQFHFTHVLFYIYTLLTILVKRKILEFIFTRTRA